jgi:hypothetical protein
MSSTVVNGVSRVGVDVGGVLIGISSGSTDTMFAGDHRAAPEVAGAVDGVAALVAALGPPNVFIISKAGDSMARKTLEWMHARDFFGRTNMLEECVRDWVTPR